METNFEKRSLLLNIKIKAAINKNTFSRDISIYFPKSFSSKIKKKKMLENDLRKWAKSKYRVKNDFNHYCFEFYVYNF